MKHKVHSVYYWREKKNFGDALAPLLLKYYSNLDTTWGTVSHSRIVTVGSVLEHIPPLWDGYILGAGKLYRDQHLHLHTGTATILGVRGPLSAARVPLGNYVIGDPGLLADEMIDMPEKRYDIGVVPHWSDHLLPAKQAFLKPHDWTTVYIYPDGDPLENIRLIGQCRKIVSSSLHGLVIADAFGIPRRFEPPDNRDGLFKYEDYHKSIGLPLIPHHMQQADRWRIETIKHELWDAFRALGDMVRSEGE